MSHVSPHTPGRGKSLSAIAIQASIGKGNFLALHLSRPRTGGEVRSLASGIGGLALSFLPLETGIPLPGRRWRFEPDDLSQVHLDEARVSVPAYGVRTLILPIEQARFLRLLHDKWFADPSAPVMLHQELWTSLGRVGAVVKTALNAVKYDAMTALADGGRGVSKRWLDEHVTSARSPVAGYKMVLSAQPD